MNKKIAKTLLILCSIYIVAFYVIKLIFPDILLQEITDPNILKLGEFIQNHIVITYIYYILSTYLTFYLFVSASKGNFKLKWQELLYILGGTAICILVSKLKPDLYVHTSTSVMFLLAWICKGKLSYSTISFVVHGFLSQFLTSIRGFETIITQINIASGIVLSFECWVWLLMLGLLFYLREKKNEHSSTIYQ